MAAKEYSVEVQSDFLERQSRALPVPAVSELIWNGLDADATQVEIELKDDGLGGLSKIIVTDNGHGIPHADAPTLFRNLGGSWKKAGAKTKSKGRVLHGQEGKGRLKAFALGAVVDWRVVYEKDGALFRYDISLIERSIRSVRISDETEVKKGKTGVSVTVSELKRNFTSLRPENALQELAEIFAIYLKNYRDVSIVYAGTKIDPLTAISRTWDVPLDAIVGEEREPHAASLEVIEWVPEAKRALYLCNEQGFPLSQVGGRFHVGDFRFSAYLKSPYIAVLQEANRLDLANMVPGLASTIEAARAKIREISKERASERARAVVEDWKARKIYPFEGEAASHLEQAERQIFDIVAVTVQEASPDFASAPQPQMAMHLRLLRHALERSPTEIQLILDQVLNLPKRKQQELARLLEETDLSGIISAATMVADRLKFLQALRFILFDFDARKKLKERSQLHKILEQNTWVFGEEYNLWASDKDLTTVLKAHRDRLDPGIIIDDPVKVVNRKRGVVDLMLSRAQRRHRANDIEHLVIELKAPRVTLNAGHVDQIEDYALAVQEDARFHRIDGLRWHFWLISDEYNKQVEARIRNGPDPLRRLVQRGANVVIGVKTWGEILEENNARLQFVKDKLEHRADEGQALAYLEERHKQFLEGIRIEEAGGEALEIEGAAGGEETP